MPIDWTGAPKQSKLKAIRDVMERLHERPPQIPIGPIMVEVRPAKGKIEDDGGLVLTLAWYVQRHGCGVALRLDPDSESRNNIHDLLRARGYENNISVHARRDLHKVCCQPVDLLWIHAGAPSSSEVWSQDPDVQLYQQARHLLAHGLIVVTETDPNTFTGNGATLVAILLADGWIAMPSGSLTAVVLEK